MQDPIHGVLGVKVRQTPCGLAITEDIEATFDNFEVTCPECIRILRIVGILPDPNRSHKRGRPRPLTRSTNEKK